MTPWETLARYRPHDGTLADFFNSRAEADADRPWLLFRGRTWSYAEAGAAIERLARALSARGVRRGNRVAVMAPNSDALVFLTFAVARLGAVLVPMNPELGPHEAGYILAHAEPICVVTTPATRPAVAGARGLLDIDALLALEGDGALPDSVGPDDDLAILYTSGTTGDPKGVVHAHSTFVLAGEGFVERMSLTPDDRLLCVLPLYHVNALFYTFGGALAAGASVVLAPRFSASGFWRLAADSGATEANLIAAVGSILARRPRSELVPHRLSKVYTAGVAPEIADVLRHELGVAAVIEGYGMTEIPGAASVPFFGPHRRGSFGLPARHPEADLRLVDDDGAEVEDGQTGELLVRTPLVMKRYHRDPAATAAAFRDGWFVTGDLARRDADGFYTFVARKKDIIRRRGENISGAELDRVLAQCPDVAEAAAVAVPSDLGEDEILAAVVRRPGASLDAAGVRAFCALHLAPSKLPRFVTFVDELPHTPTHRVAKFKLRADASILAHAVDLEAKR